MNYESYPIEASYIFPLDERAAVCGFEAEIAGNRIVGEAKEKQEAKRFGVERKIFFCLLLTFFICLEKMILPSYEGIGLIFLKHRKLTSSK